MAKKDKKKKDKQDDKGVDDVLAAVRGAFEKLGVSGDSAASTRERTQAIVDEIAAAAGKVRNSLEDMRVLDEVKRLRREVEALASRVASLEIRPAEKPVAVPATKPVTVEKPAARKAAARKKPAARKAAAKPAAVVKTPAAKKRAATRKPSTAKKRAAKKPSAAAKNPAAPKPTPTPTPTASTPPKPPATGS